MQRITMRIFPEYLPCSKFYRQNHFIVIDLTIVNLGYYVNKRSVQFPTHLFFHSIYIKYQD